MKIYLCFLRNAASKRSGVDSQFLGAATSESLALNLCAIGVISRTSKTTKSYLRVKNWVSSDKSEEKRLEKNLKEEQEEFHKRAEEIFTSGVTSLEELNKALKKDFRKIGVAERWCEIQEVETDEPAYFD